MEEAPMLPTAPAPAAPQLAAGIPPENAAEGQASQPASMIDTLAQETTSVLSTIFPAPIASETKSTPASTKKKRSQCPVRHWYREPYQLRRGVVQLNTTTDVALGDFSGSTALPDTAGVSTVGLSPQFEMLREFFKQSSASVAAWRTVGYIYAERSFSGQVARPPGEQDKLGMPTDHVHFPIVVCCDGHWYLPCSWGDRCRLHHELFFGGPTKRESASAAGGEEQPHGKRRHSSMAAAAAAAEAGTEGGGLQYTVVRTKFPWEDVVKAEAMRRYGAEPTVARGEVQGLLEIAVPPGDTNGKRLKELFPDCSQWRNIWRSQDANSKEGLCSLSPTSKLRKEDGRMFIAVVSMNSPDKWTPTMEFIEVPLHLSAPGAAAPGDSSSQVEAVVDVVSGNIGQKRIETLLLPVFDTTLTVFQTTPSPLELFRAAKLGIQLTELIVAKSSSRKVIRGVLRGPMTLALEMVRSLEEGIPIDLTRSRFGIAFEFSTPVEVTLECFSAPDAAAWNLNKDEAGLVGLISTEGQELKRAKVQLDARYGRCEFATSGRCVVQCGPNETTRNFADEYPASWFETDIKPPVPMEGVPAVAGAPPATEAFLSGEQPTR